MSVRSDTAAGAPTGIVCCLAIGLGIVVYVAGVSAVTPLVVATVGSDALERLIAAESPD